MRVVVTGAGGFIGRHVVLELTRAGHRVTSVARQASAPPAVEQHCAGDVRDAQTGHALPPTDAIVHLAGFSDASLSLDRPVEYNMTNAAGTLFGLEAARQRDALFILASSQRVYRSSLMPVAEDAPLEPVDPYGYSKLIAEQWAAMYRRLYGLPALVLRFFSVYGPGQLPGTGTSGVVALFTGRALRGEELIVHGEARRDFTYVTDVAAGVRLALECGCPRDAVYNVATGIATTTEELAHAVVAATGSSSPVRLRSPAEQGESYIASIARAEEKLGYRPAVRLKHGLERYAQWLREQR